MARALCPTSAHQLPPDPAPAVLCSPRHARAHVATRRRPVMPPGPSPVPDPVSWSPRINSHADKCQMPLILSACSEPQPAPATDIASPGADYSELPELPRLPAPILSPAWASLPCPFSPPLKAGPVPLLLHTLNPARAAPIAAELAPTWLATTAHPLAESPPPSTSPPPTVAPQPLSFSLCHHSNRRTSLEWRNSTAAFASPFPDIHVDETYPERLAVSSSSFSPTSTTPARCRLVNVRTPASSRI